MAMVDRDEIILFVKDRLGFTPSSQTKFWWETGTAGLDAWIFMVEFAKRYGVDMEDFGRVDYGDSDVPIADLLSNFMKRVRFQNGTKNGFFTLDHLVEVANRKKWFDPVNV